jgi:hypothetical protein
LKSGNCKITSSARQKRQGWHRWGMRDKQGAEETILSLFFV